MRSMIGLLTLALVITGTLQAARRHRIVYVQAVRYKVSVTHAQAEEMLRDLKRTFRKLPQVRSIRIGRVERSSGPAYEYAVIMEFDSLEDLESYGKSDLHRGWVKKHAGGLIDQHLMLTVDAGSLDK